MKRLRKAGFLAFFVVLWLTQLSCGNQYRPVANPVIPPGGQPQTQHAAWVLNYNPTGDGSTTQIDVSGDTNVAVNSMGKGSAAEAFPANSLALYIANSGDDTVSEYLPTLAGPITTISLLPGSHPIALASANNTLMNVLNSGENSKCSTSGSVSVIQAATLSVNSTTCLVNGANVGDNPTALAQSPFNGLVYVLNQGSPGSVWVFNPAGPSILGVITLPTGQNPVSVTASLNGDWIFVVAEQGMGAGVLDIISTSVTPPAVTATAPLGVGPGFSIIDPNLNRLYVANTGGNSVSVFDAANVSSSGSIPLLGTASVGTNPIGITPLANGSLFYVLNSGSNNVTVVSANSFTAQTSVALPAGANPVFIASDPTSSKVYVADMGTSETTVIQTSNNAIATNIPAPSQIIGCTVCALQQPIMIVTQ